MELLLIRLQHAYHTGPIHQDEATVLPKTTLCVYDINLCFYHSEFYYNRICILEFSVRGHDG